MSSKVGSELRFGSEMVRADDDLDDDDEDDDDDNDGDAKDDDDDDNDDDGDDGTRLIENDDVSWQPGLRMVENYIKYVNFERPLAAWAKNDRK